MRVFLVVAAALPILWAGCSGPAPLDLVECDGAFHPVRLFLGPDLSLRDTVPSAGSVPGNSFAGAFLTDDLDEWLSQSILEPLHLEGDVKLTLFVRFEGSPAPIPRGDPGDGYQFFNQFGSDRTFQPGFAVEAADAAQVPGTQAKFIETIALPESGFELEAGDRVRLLLTSLAADSQTGSGHAILYGNPHASHLDFQARCAPSVQWMPLDDRVHDIEIIGNQGLFTGQLGQPELAAYNTATVPLALQPETKRLTIDLAQGSDPNPAKDDIDLDIVAANGTALWSIGSPYSNEHGVLWDANLAWLHERGATSIRVNSYSGVAYQGTLSITQERAAFE